MKNDVKIGMRICLCVYGFLLVGSIFENFLHVDLEKVILKERVVTLLFIVIVIALNGGKQASAEAKGTLRVAF